MHGGGWWSYIAFDDTKGRPSLTRGLVRRVAGYARPYWVPTAVMIALIGATSLIELIPPLLFRELIDVVLPTRDVGRLNVLALALVGIPVATGLLGVAERYFSARIGEGIIYDLRQEMYDHLVRMSLRFFTHTKAGEIMSRFNNDVVGAQNAVTGTLPNIFTNTITLVSTLAVMISIEWRLAVLSVAVLPLFLLPSRRVGRVLRRLRREGLEYNADMSNIVSETLSISGALLVKTFGRQRDEVGRFRTSNGKVRDIGVRRAMVGRWFFLGLSIAGAIGTALIYWVGGHLVLGNAISVGTIVAFTAYLTRLYGPISALSNVQVEFVTSMVSFERVFEYLDLPIEIDDRPGAVVLEQVDGRVEFHDVSFSYLPPEVRDAAPDSAAPGSAAPGSAAPGSAAPGSAAPAMAAPSPAAGDGAGPENGGPTPMLAGEPVSAAMTRRWALCDLSFAIEPGQLAALVGPSGAGKTSITYLLPRLYDPTEGHISIDGHDLRDVTQESLARQIGMVTQESYLFHDTVRANLLYARPDATQAELEAACRAANIHDLFAGLPEGYDTVVGERGYRLSGGEKQRLAIARVILKDPCLLILDEATSHLDSQSEALIQAALEPLLAGRTSLVIAHRLSTILAADKILVLEEGRLVESGTHAELLARGGLYAHLYETQFRARAEGSAAPDDTIEAVPVPGGRERVTSRE